MFTGIVEEVGELAQALAERERGDGDQANLESEFADVLAWLATLANINEVDLTRAIDAKYVELRDGDRLRPAAIYVVCGLDADGKKRVLACVCKLGRENLEEWKSTMESDMDDL